MNINFDGLVCYLNAKPSSKKQEQWIDSSSNNNNAILTNVSDNDFNGEYIQFTGNNYATLPRCIQDDFTISAEVVLERSTSTNDAAQAWFSYAALIDAEASGIRNDFGLTISKDGHAYFGVGNPDQTISYTQQSLFNKKHVITCTRHKTTGAIALYIDGNLIKKHFHPNKSSLTYSPSIYIGKGINNKYLLMKLFSVRLYNRVLNEFEIKQDMFLIKEKEYVNNNNLPKIVEKLSAASNIKITGNKYGNRVQTVIDKIVEKADNVTKAINQEVVNNAHSFKAGAGNNVNVSTDVQDSFSEIAIKGQTYQNLLGRIKNVGSAYTVSNDQYSINLPSGSGQPMILYELSQILKPNTKYTLCFEVKRYTTGYPHVCFMSKDNSKLASTTEYVANSTGIKKVVLQTKADVDANIFRILPRNGIDNNWSIGKNILILEGDHTNNPNLPSYFEGIVGVGDKSKNLFNGELYSGWEDKISDYKTKDNIITDLIKVEIGKSYIPSDNGFRYVFGFDSNSKYIGHVQQYPFTNANYSYVRFGKSIAKANIPNKDTFKKFQIIEEGKISTQYESYYDGYKIQVKSTGKNLVNPLIPYPYSIKKNSTNDGALLSVVKVKPNTKYTMSVNRTENKGRIIAKFSNRLIHSYEVSSYNQGHVFNFLRDNYANGRQFEYTINSGDKITFTTLDDCNYIYLNIDGAYGGTFNTGDFVTTINSVQIEESAIATSYELYKQDKLELLLDEPLMKLPNGVYDEITKDGKLIRRIGKIVLDGSDDEKWWIHNDEKVTKRFRLSLVSNSNQTSQPAGWCDSIPFYPNKSWQADRELIELDTGAISIRKSFNTVIDFKNWLKTNPVTLYYELSNPIITDLSNNQIKLFENGSLTFNTLVAPESTHIVQLNKSAQIQNTIKQSQLLDNKIAVLEKNYDSLMLSTMSTLNDLEFDYTLK